MPWEGALGVGHEVVSGWAVVGADYQPLGDLGIEACRALREEWGRPRCWFVPRTFLAL